MYQVLQAPPVALDSDGYMIQEAPTTAEVFIGEEEISPEDLFAEDDNLKISKFFLNLIFDYYDIESFLSFKIQINLNSKCQQNLLYLLLT